MLPKEFLLLFFCLLVLFFNLLKLQYRKSCVCEVMYSTEAGLYCLQLYRQKHSANWSSQQGKEKKICVHITSTRIQSKHSESVCTYVLHDEVLQTVKKKKDNLFFLEQMIRSRSIVI